MFANYFFPSLGNHTLVSNLNCIQGRHTFPLTFTVQDVSHVFCEENAMLSSVTDNIMHIYLNKMVFNLTKSKSKLLIPANLKSHLGSSIAIPLWGYQVRKRSSLLPLGFPTHHLTSVTLPMRKKLFCKLLNSCFWHDKWISPCSLREFLPSQMCTWHGGQKQDCATGSLAACTLRPLLCWKHCWLVGHTWVTPPVDSRTGRERACPTHLIAASDLFCSLPTLLQTQIKCS